jgi:lipid-A-disaccharide synthase-like uncharacterized protein
VLLAHALALAALLLAGGSVHARTQEAARGAEPPRTAPAVEWNGVLDLQERLKDVQVETDGEGRHWIVVDAPGGPLRLAPDEFAVRLESVQEEQRRHGFLYTLLNITTPWGCLWVGLGFLGQALFTFRMVLQWWVSEKERRSVVPTAFWWGSLIGGAMLFTYFVWRKDIVGIVGQSTGLFVYARNLVLIHRTRAAARTEDGRSQPRTA